MSRIFLLFFSGILLAFVGCKTHQSSVSKVTSGIERDSVSLLPCPGCEIDFKAQGSNPPWSLEIDFEKEIRFINPENTVVIFPSVEGVKSEDGKIVNYKSKNGSSELIITIYDEKNTDSLTGEKYSSKVKVDQQSGSEKDYKVYTGFGNYQLNYRLHNIWAFQEVNGQRLIAESYSKGIPVIELFVDEKKILGHDGCNQIFGAFYTSGNTITFGSIASTLMACPKESIDVSKLLHGSYQFQFGHNQLILFQNGEVIMKLKNVD